MSDGILEVFTAKSVSQILDYGGSQSWVLNPDRLRHVSYVVCCRNDDHAYDEECGVRVEPRNAAFMVGKIGGFEKVERRNDRDRYLVLFSEYAECLVPEFRAGSVRNPVIYGDVDSARLRGLDVDTLKFRLMPPRKIISDSPEPIREAGLSIAAAKEGLAIRFGVPVEDIQITING